VQKSMIRAVFGAKVRENARRMASLFQAARHFSGTARTPTPSPGDGGRLGWGRSLRAGGATFEDNVVTTLPHPALPPLSWGKESKPNGRFTRKHVSVAHAVKGMCQ
jgi:hypothetical protein